MSGPELIEADAAHAAEQGREVVKGISTQRTIPGEPYDLAGKRLFFTSWYYIRPGKLDWLNAKGESVYVKGSEGPWGAHYKGIDTPRGIRIMAEKPQCMGPVKRPGRILQDGAVLRGWDGGLMESTDGLQWEKKADLVDYPDGSVVFMDPAGPAEERYKSAWAVDDITIAEFEAFHKRRPDGWEPRSLMHYGDDKVISGIRGAVSADGIHWKHLPEPLVVEYSDTEVVAHYDPQLRKYVLYTRYWSIGPYTHKLPADIRHSWTGAGRRAIGRSESDDFHHFPPSEMIVEPGPDMAPSHVLYTNSRTAFPGAPDHHLMFPTIWRIDQDNTMITMMSSHDGKVWNFLPGMPLRETPPFGEWDGGCIWASPNLVEFADGTFALPYRGDSVPHKYPRGQRTAHYSYLTWPKGRIVALEAPDRGEFATLMIMPPGRKLRINAVTERVGSITIQVEGIPGRSFAESTPIAGDQHWTPVTWNGQEDLGFKEGAPIMLRFRMDKAKIYGLEFA